MVGKIKRKAFKNAAQTSHMVGVTSHGKCDFATSS